MGIILWIVFGALVGWIASMIMHTNEQQGVFLNIGIGIIGAIVGGGLMSAIGEHGIGGFDLYSFIVALVGACAFIAAMRMLD